MEPIRINIMINDRILEQVSHFNYLDNDIGYERNYDIGAMLGNFQTTCGTINSFFQEHGTSRYNVNVRQRRRSRDPLLLNKSWTRQHLTLKWTMSH